MGSASLFTIVLVVSLGHLVMASSLDTSVARERQGQPAKLKVVTAPTLYHCTERSRTPG